MYSVDAGQRFHFHCRKSRHGFISSCSGVLEPASPVHSPAAKGVAWRRKQWHSRGWKFSKTPLASFLASMTRFLPALSAAFSGQHISSAGCGGIRVRPRPADPACTVFGTAARLEAGRMTKAEGQEISNQRLTAEAKTPGRPQALRCLRPPRRLFGSMKTILPAIPTVSQIRHFRAPPFLALTPLYFSVLRAPSVFDHPRVTLAGPLALRNDCRPSNITEANRQT